MTTTHIVRPVSVREASDTFHKASKGYRHAIVSSRISASDALELERRFRLLRTKIEIAVVGPEDTMDIAAPDAELMTALIAWSEEELHLNIKANKPPDLPG
jgi:hypothetical protein